MQSTMTTTSPGTTTTTPGTTTPTPVTTTRTTAAATTTPAPTAQATASTTLTATTTTQAQTTPTTIVTTAVVPITETTAASATTTATPTLSTTAGTTAPTSALTSEAITPAPEYVISADLKDVPYTDAYNDTSSTEFQELAQKLIGPCNAEYRKKYPSKFSKCRVKSFRPITVRETGVQAEMGIVFNSNVSTSELPKNSAIAQTFADAANNTNSTLSTLIEPNSVSITAGPVPTTTNAPSATTLAPTAVTPAITTTTTTTAAATITKRLVFRSITNTFTTDLLDSTSSAFKQRKSMITEQLTPFFREFRSFRGLEVLAFANGSVVNFLNAQFLSSSAPNNSQIASVLINAAQNVTGFDIETSSIIIDGISSSGVSQNISLITAFFLVLLSRLLSNQQ
uniref:integumentary mucin C.1-like n=1 Tax=Solea senegalensis TaxID=28829 RepID=UPI001CD8F900|nr:integumentary mucin C.1-like [Solea senegalensis]